MVLSGYPDSHLAPATGIDGKRRFRRIALAIVPLAALAVWFFYLYSVSSVLPSVEKYKNGSVMAEGYVRRASLLGPYKRHGRWVTYHTNGRKESEGFYELGEKTGSWSYWDDSGLTVAPGHPSRK